VDAHNGAQLAEIQRLRNAAWEAIGTATVDGSERHRYWKAWQMHCGLYQDATGEIQAPHILKDRLLTFAVAVREGQYGKGHQIQVQSVEFALRAITQKYVLDGYPDPRCASPTQQSLDLPITHLLKKYGNEDPPPKPKLAVPIYDHSYCGEISVDRPSQRGRGFGHHCILLPPSIRREYITCHSTEETDHTVAGL